MLVLKERWTAPKQDRGATMVEYGLLVALIAVVLIFAVMFFSDSMNDALYEKAGNCMSAVSS